MNEIFTYFLNVKFTPEMRTNLTYILAIGLFMYFSYLLPILFSKKIKFLKLHTNYKIIFQTEFYKIPLRWFSLLFFVLYAAISKKGRTYLKEIFVGKYDEEWFDDQVLTYMGKAKSYHFSIFLGNTINYFQRVRFFHTYKSSNPLHYNGFFGWLKWHSDNYQLVPEGKRFILLQQRRFDFDTRIPKNRVGFFISNENVRFDQYKLDLHKKEMKEIAYKLNEGFNDLDIVTRSIDNSGNKRFD